MAHGFMLPVEIKLQDVFGLGAGDWGMLPLANRRSLPVDALCFRLMHHCGWIRMCRVISFRDAVEV